MNGVSAGPASLYTLKVVGISPTSWGWGGGPLVPEGETFYTAWIKGEDPSHPHSPWDTWPKHPSHFCTPRERAWESRSESGILRPGGWLAAELTLSNTSYYYSCWQLFAIVDSYLFFTTYWRQKLNQCSQTHLGNLNGSRYFFTEPKTRVELSYFLGYWPSWPCSDHWDYHCLGGKRLTNLLEQTSIYLASTYFTLQSDEWWFK